MTDNTTSGVPTPHELELINGLSRKKLEAHEVYTFNVTLCDNEIDRDNERFTVEAIKELSSLFLGKTGILDHSMKASDQTARIYCTEVSTDSARKTSGGEDYVRLNAKAYMVRTRGNEDLIAEIDGGIKKEVSVSCSISSAVCSVCGEDVRNGCCEHVRGKIYGGRLCHAVLSDPTDAYEWSFVAVPAQREAGVTKAYTVGRPAEALLSVIKSGAGDVLLSAEQADELRRTVESMETLAEDGRSYREELCGQIEKYARIVMPQAGSLDFAVFGDSMTVKQLRSLRDSLLSRANETLPLTLQLKAKPRTEESGNKSFII